MSETLISKPLNEAINFVIGNCYLQIQGEDVAYPYIAGAPGGGKTASIMTMANEQNSGLVSTHFSLKPLEETGGIPQFEKVKVNGEEIISTIWSFPDIMKILYQEAEKYKDTMVVWLLDDMHLCGSVHMSLMYELLTERKLREYNVPDNVAIVLAGNHGSNKAGAKTMFSAIINRICMMNIFTDYDNWKKNFASGRLHPAILSFLDNKQYSQFFHEPEEVDNPWCSPRSWTRFSNLITNFEQWSPNKRIVMNDLLYLGQGHISKKAASEFSKYYDIFMKFDVEKILNDIDNYKLPNDMMNRYALAYASITFYFGLTRRVNYIDSFVKLIKLYIDESPELAYSMFIEIINTERNLKLSNISIQLIDKLRDYDESMADQLIEEIKNVD